MCRLLQPYRMVQKGFFRSNLPARHSLLHRVADGPRGPTVISPLWMGRPTYRELPWTHPSFSTEKHCVLLATLLRTVPR